MNKYILLTSCLVLGACVGLKSDGKPLAKMTFEHIKPKPIYVASYETVPLAVSDKPNLPIGFVAAPSEIVFDYLNNRFEAAGNNGKFRIIIDSMKIAHDIVPSTNEVGAALGIGKQDHYHMTLKVNLELIGIGQQLRRGVTMTVNRDLYISEHVNLVQREKEQMAAIDAMIDDLDGALHKTMKDDFNILR